MPKCKSNGEGSLRFREDKQIWEYRATVGVQDNGKPDQKSFYHRAPNTPKGEKEALAACRKKAEDFKAHPLEYNPAMKIGVLADMWYAYEKQEMEAGRLEESTYKGYGHTLALIKDKWQAWSIGEFSAMTFLEQIYEIKKPVYQKDKDGKFIKGVKKGTFLVEKHVLYDIGMYKKIKCMMGQIFNYAVLKKFILPVENPMPLVPDLKDSERKKSEQSSYTLEQFVELYKKLSNDVWGHMVRLDLACGGRGQEIRALRDTDIEPDGSMIEVSKAIKRALVGEKEGKTKTEDSDRFIHVPGFARPSAIFLRNHAINGYILYSPRTKKAFCYTGYLKNYNRVVKDTKVNRRPPHEMRASFIYLMREYVKISDKVLQTMSGHGDRDTMLGYDRPHDVDRQAAADALDALISPLLNPTVPKKAFKRVPK
jgi:integrase